MSNKNLAISLWSFLLLVGSCSLQVSSTDNGGSSSEVVAVRGQAVYEDGSAAANAVVRLRPASYLAPSIISLGKASVSIINSMTDESGHFALDSVSPGEYILEVNNLLGQAAVQSCTTDAKQAAKVLDPAVLAPTSPIIGTVALPNNAIDDISVKVYGLERSTHVDPATKSFILNDIPPGYSYTLRLEPRSAVYAPKIVELVSAGDTLDTIHIETFDSEDYGSWPFSKKLYINTSSTGASVAENVIHFPLLISIAKNQYNFADFSDPANGTDIRFSKADGTHLHYEIESWDSGAGYAAIWVAVDTVYGNSATQNITLHWGKKYAPDWSGGATVFDTAQGFAGVWHFAPLHPFTDATSNNNNAIDSGSSAFQGIIGGARFFSGVNGGSFMKVPDNATLEPRCFSLSCWVQIADANSNSFAKFVNKGKPGDSADFPSYSLEIRNQSDIVGFQIESSDRTFHTVESAPLSNPQTWHFLTGTFDLDSGIGIFYVDGQSAGSFTCVNPIQYYPEQQYALYFGSQYGGTAAVRAAIDEIRLHRTINSAAWVKLSYENQRTGSRLVQVQ
jgi:hypothetical protein